jgi:1-deoxy-D-xylulose-5-phosphate reductoisomerase
MKRIAILGSTGSIGRNTLDVIKRFPGKFRVAALTAHSNIDILLRQIKVFCPEFVCVADKEAGVKLKSRLGRKVKLLAGEVGLTEIAGHKGIDKVVLAITGAGALRPLLAAIDSGKEVALANKESLVMAGSIVMPRALKKKAKIIPIDSEQSAIWQCLAGEDKDGLRAIHLTASGGPLRELGRDRLKDVSVEEVLRHPRWKMGKKITVDSATLMNKGLEVIEAMHLFGVGPEKIKVVIHPEAIIHSMVEFVDGSIIAQLSVTDMRIPIQYALSYPDRLANNLSGVDFYKLRRLNFQKPDFGRFPCLRLAYRAAHDGGTAPCVLNAANEVCVEEFLQNRLKFISLPKIIERVLGKHHNIGNPCLNDIYHADGWAREKAKSIIRRMG